MASLESLEFHEIIFADAIKTACTFLSIEGFYQDQEEALHQVFKGEDLFFSANTGYGKSLIFQAIPVIADVMKDNNIGTGTVLVLTPINSLINDKVSHVNKVFGISTAAIFEGQDEDVFRAIEEGAYSIIYATPDSFIANKRWRTLATSETFREDCVAVVVDEAHCLVQW